MLKLIKWGVLALITIQLVGVSQAMPPNVFGKGAKRMRRLLRWVASEASNLAAHHPEPKDWDQVLQVRLWSCQCVANSEDFLALVELLVDDLHEMLQKEGSVVPDYAHKVLDFLITDLEYRDQMSIFAASLTLQFYLSGEEDPKDQGHACRLVYCSYGDPQWRFTHEQAAFEVLLALLRLTSADGPLRGFILKPARLLLSSSTGLPIDALAQAMKNRRLSEFCWRPLYADPIYGHLADLNLSVQQVGSSGTLGHMFALALAMRHPFKSSLLGQLAILAMYGRTQDPCVLARRIQYLLTDCDTVDTD